MAKTVKTDKTELLKLAAERFKYSEDEDRAERELYYQDVRFGIDDEGCQWDKNIREIREKDSPPRPCLSINKIPEKIDMVEGEFKQLRPSFKLRAVDSHADPIVADVMAGMVRHCEYISNSRSAYNHSHTSVLYGGRGAWRHDIVDDDNDPFVRKIEINRIPNVLSVYFDPKAKREDKSDAQYWFVTDLLTKTEFENKYPDYDLESWPGDSEWDSWRTEDSIRVAEYWYKEKTSKTFYRIERDIEGIPTEMTVTELEEGEAPLKEITTDVTVVKWCIMTAGQVLDGPHDWPTPYIPVFFESGKSLNIGGKNKMGGMVRFAKTPQSMYNYWSSSNTETVALAPKVPYIMTPTMLGPYGPMWDELNVRNRVYALYNADPNAPGARPFREAPPQLSTAQAAELVRMDHDIMSAMGIYQASLGDRGDEKSGKAITARQRQGNIGTYAFTENFATIYTYSIKALIALIPHVYDSERIERIIGDDGEEYSIPINARPGFAQGAINNLPPQMQDKYISKPRPGVTQYLNDLNVGTYDVRVSIGPSYTTQREELVATLMDLIKLLPPNIAIAVAPIIAESLDMPDSVKIVEAIKRASGIGEDGQPLPKPPDPALLLEQAKMQLETMKQRDEVMLKRQEQDRKDYETQVNAVKTMVESQTMTMGQRLTEIVAALDALREHQMMTQEQNKPNEGVVTNE